MITEIRIENFKSIASLTLQPGRVTVLIGENGSGKSNILEAIAFGAGAAGNKLDREFLYSRGIRVTEAEWMRSAFSEQDIIHLYFAHHLAANELDYSIVPRFSTDGLPNIWTVSMPVGETEVSVRLGSKEVSQIASEFTQRFDEIMERVSGKDGSSWKDSTDREETLRGIKEAYARNIAKVLIGQEKTLSVVPLAEEVGLTGFLIYAPENTVLRKFDPEGAIEPLEPVMNLRLTF